MATPAARAARALVAMLKALSGSGVVTAGVVVLVAGGAVGSVVVVLVVVVLVVAGATASPSTACMYAVFILREMAIARGGGQRIGESRNSCV